MSIQMYFFLFIIYSFIGWSVEVVKAFYDFKKFVNRGFFIGPYCPIYGCGGLLIIFTLSKYMDDMFILFIMAVVVCSILEYLTSFIMEKLFRTRWWDYSDYKFNINGRVCLETMWVFGALACIVMYCVNPPLLAFFNSMPTTLFNILFYVLFVIFFADVIISFVIISGVKKTADNIKKDSTEEMTAYVRETLSKKSFLSKRLVNAFPDFQSIIKNIGNGIGTGINKGIKITKSGLNMTKTGINKGIKMTKSGIDKGIRITKLGINKTIGKVK